MSDPLLESCPNCATLLDVSDEDPFAQVHCPMCGTAMRVRRQFHNFQLQGVLGSGGMGAVYAALDMNLDRRVALKLLRKEFSSDPAFLAKFEYEARITASINHPHVVKVFSFGSDHNVLYLAMELVDKGSLDELMNLQGRVAEMQILHVAMQIAQGLEAAQQAGLIHRDVKPGNILFANAHTAKIVDFGLAMPMEQKDESGEIWGTPYYIAPEKLNNEPEDFRSDIYSLGGTLFHALAGRPPFEAESASLVALKHLKSQSVSIQAFAPDISSATAYVINRMLHKDPEERYQSYADLVEHLQYAKTQLMEVAEQPRQPKARVVMESEEQQSVMSWIILALIGLIVVGGLVLYFNRDRFTDKGGSRELAQQVVPGEGVEERYQEARSALRSGEVSTAAAQLTKLEEEGVADPPLAQWITFHKGLALLMSGQLSEGQAAFKQLQDAGMYTEEDAQRRLADFFVETGRLMAGGQKVPGSFAANLDGNTMEAASLLAFGLQNWERGNFPDAKEFFDAYMKAAPAAPYQWTADYKPVAQKYLEDYAAYTIVAAKVEAAKTEEDKAAAAEALNEVRNQLKVPGRMTQELYNLQEQLKRAVTSAVTEREDAARQTAAQKAAQERKALTAAALKLRELAAKMQVADALREVEGVKVTTPTLQKEYEELLKKARWMVAFKEQMIADINAGAYPGEIVRRAGPPLAGGVSRASDAQLEQVSQYGSVPLPWEDLAPAGIAAIADHYLQKQPSPERTWLAGVYSLQAGRQTEGQALLLQASQEQAPLRDELPLFFATAEVR